jgi:hypothetical protein
MLSCPEFLQGGEKRQKGVRNGSQREHAYNSFSLALKRKRSIDLRR